MRRYRLIPSAYSFTVQPYGLPAGQADTAQLAPGTQTYLEIQWLASWEEGYPETGWGVRAQYLRHPDDVAPAGTGLSSGIGLSPTIILPATTTVSDGRIFNHGQPTR